MVHLAIEDPVLNRLLRKGLVLPHDPQYGLVILLRGKAGTGKSTLALQLLDEMHKAKRSNRIYCTLEQSQADLKARLALMWATRALGMAWTPDSLEPEFHINRAELKNQLLTRLTAPEVATITANLKGVLRRKLQFDKQSDAPNTSDEVIGRLTNAIVTALSQPGNVRGRMEICDTQSFSQRNPESPFGGVHRRCVAALDILTGLTEKLPDRKKNPTVADRAKLPIVVLDGMSLLSEWERETVTLHGIIDKMRQSFQLSILVYEPNPRETTYLDHHADMVIELAEKPSSQHDAYLIHELCIQKARYQEAALGRHQFKIRGSGIAVFPSLHFQVQHRNYMDLELKRSDGRLPPAKAGANESAPPSLKAGSIIDMICGPGNGESVVLLGPRNAFKTELCLDFLCCGTWGCPRRLSAQTSPGLLISLIDNAPDIQTGLSCPWSEKSKKCPWAGAAPCKRPTQARVSHAKPFCQRPGCITPAEFFHYMRSRILSMQLSEADKHRRVVFWDLTQMDYRFPLFRDDRMLLPAMMDTFKTHGVRSLFMGAGNAANTKSASAMADHVLFCWRSKGGNGKQPSLMLYVDRASAASRRTGKALFSIPVVSELTPVVSERLVWDPALLDKDEAKNGYRIDLADLSSRPDDDKEIKRITEMQGVS